MSAREREEDPHLVLVVKLTPTRQKSGIEKFFRQWKMNVNESHTCTEGMRRRFPHEFNTETMHPAHPILSCGNL